MAEDAYPVGVADEVVTVLRAASAVILGGDFWVREADGFTPTNSNWYYNDGESPESVNAARKAIRQSWVDPAWFVSFVWV